MLTITVPGQELYNEATQEFTTYGDTVLQFEHSLVSLSKWESLFKKPFLTKQDKSPEELLEYVKVMCITENTPGEIFHRLSQDNMEAINGYINNPMSATWFSESKTVIRSREVVTSELIYYWMTAYNIPLECEHWHLNRLFTLIRVANAKNAPPKKQSQQEIAQRQREINMQRRAEMGTSG